jgi:hypothetical protein
METRKSPSLPARRDVEAEHVEGARPEGPVRDTTDEAIAHHLFLALCIAIPVFMVVWAGLIALAAHLANFAVEGPLLMGVGVGALAGIFWAGWYAFVSYARAEEIERHRPKPGASAT